MTKNELILISIYKLSKGEKLALRYEDIAVFALSTFPNKMHLPGYPQYPHADLVKKRIYDTLKPNGYVRTAGGKIELTDYGIKTGKELAARLESEKPREQEYELSESELKEFNRLGNLQGFSLYLCDPAFSPIDVDFYDFYLVTVRTNLNEVKGRIRALEKLLDMAISLGLDRATDLKEYKNRLDSLYKEMTKVENNRRTP